MSFYVIYSKWPKMAELQTSAEHVINLQLGERNIFFKIC